jgi:predicted trehalose synthase
MDPLKIGSTLHDGLVIDNHARVIHFRMQHAIGVGLRRQHVAVERRRPVLAARRVDLEHGHDLARLGFFDQMAVVQPPPCRQVDAEGAALMLRMHARSGPNVEDSYFENVTWLRAFDMNGPRQQVNAEAFARTAGCADHAPGAAPHDVLALGRPAVHGLHARIASDHQIVIVTGVVREGFDRREIA